MPGNMPTVVVGRHARGHREDGHPETVSQTAGEILTREGGLMECDRTIKGVVTSMVVGVVVEKINCAGSDGGQVSRFMFIPRIKT
ncbi:predicted protein [Coccidioides posadasii str. Silveira]|uniref:Predicted protein n=1 Tax=Coccidioides posadasii (strain RMSCC 757 / Silveira) TaxID=443226 RepID=E9DGC4_COCPS|nr:predicted protein [Coccidioides posadasii str. Silveira]